MAVHLKMDFRVVELPGNINVLQCDRGSADCLYEVEYDRRLAGAMVQAIHRMRHHACDSAGGHGNDSAAGPKSVQPVLPLFARKLSTVSRG